MPLSLIIFSLFKETSIRTTTKTTKLSQVNIKAIMN
jgi:hypothetical protein